MIEIDYLVQVVKIPDDLIEVSRDANAILYRTYKVYEILVQSNLLWRVWHVDEYGKVWLEVNLVNDTGEPEFHTIALDEGTYLKVSAESYEALDELK
ncbi:hypothetical protein ACFFUS_00005 [Vibrio gallaecicus]|uniref:Uncharacterized protein n=1 Tax=Vibrio gallaecicus TaxID=552386 RepID=A0ABV4NGG3_9VIBR|nr:hypothetical protein [Vibrio gallaecicus]